MDAVQNSKKIRSMIKLLRLSYGKSFNDLIEIFSINNFEIRDILTNKLPKKLDLVSAATLHDMKVILSRQQIATTIDEENAAIVVRHGGLSNKAFTYRIVSICPFGPCVGTIKTYWIIHAYHRAFTINSLFLELNGTVHDYFEGYNDILNNQVRMNLDPDNLIKANHLRIFEYFELFGSLAEAKSDHHEITLNSIAANMDVLADISGEVISNGVKSFLMQSRRLENIIAFLKCRGATYLGLPDQLNIIEFQDVAEKSNFPNHPLLGISYLSAFLETQEDVMKVHRRLKLTSYERDLAIFLVEHKKSTQNIDDLAHYKQMCSLSIGANQQVSREYVLELLKYHNKKTLFHDLLLTQSSACFNEQSKPMELASCPVVPEVFQINVSIWTDDATNASFSETGSILVGLEPMGWRKRKSKKKARLH